nr:AAA family ATPase [Streptomyces sp. SM10]
MLTKPFTAWRTFLHPTQRCIAYRPGYAGPAQITGGPGTGKTVVALRRVKHLLDRAPDTRVLLTTYTGALARFLQSSLALLLYHDRRCSPVSTSPRSTPSLTASYGNCAATRGPRSATGTSAPAGSAWPAASNCPGTSRSCPRSTGTWSSPRTCGARRST